MLFTTLIVSAHSFCMSLWSHFALAKLVLRIESRIWIWNDNEWKEEHSTTHLMLQGFREWANSTRENTRIITSLTSSRSTDCDRASTYPDRDRSNHVTLMIIIKQSKTCCTKVTDWKHAVCINESFYIELKIKMFSVL